MPRRRWLSAWHPESQALPLRSAAILQNFPRHWKASIKPSKQRSLSFGKLKTLMNIRKEPSLEAEVVTVYPMNTIVEVLEVCDNWLKIKCPEAENGIAYVLNEDGTYAFVGKAVYDVVAGDNLWRIAERKLGSGTRYTDIRELNGLTSNAIRIGMKLLLP